MSDKRRDKQATDETARNAASGYAAVVLGIACFLVFLAILTLTVRVLVGLGAGATVAAGAAAAAGAGV